MPKLYDDEKLKELLVGVKTTSEMIKKIDEARKNDPYFQGKTRRAIELAMKRRGLLEDLKVDTQGVTYDWPKEKLDKFLKAYGAGVSVGKLKAEYGCESDQQVRNIAKVHGVAREKKVPRSVKGNKKSDKTVNNRLMALIRDGFLLEKNGLEKLHQIISDEFPNNKFDKRKFKRRVVGVTGVIWKQKEIKAALEKTLEAELDPLDSFKETFPFIPDKVITARAKWYRGLISGVARKLMGEDRPGIFNIDLSGADPKFKMPKTSFDKPFVVKTAKDKEPSLFFLNGSSLGVLFNPNIVKNAVRRALSEAWGRQYDAVILTNFICLDMKKAGGPAKAARAQIAGDNVNPDLIRDEEYRKTVKRILRQFPMDEVIYRTPEEFVNDIFGGWAKIATRPNHRPEFNGPILVSLGMNERAVIDALNYWQINLLTRQKQHELDVEVSLAKKRLANAKKALEESEDEGGAAVAQARADVKKCIRELKQWQARRSKVTITNTANQEYQRFNKYTQSVFIQKVEQAIPNAKVIGQGTNHIQINGKKVKIDIPPHVRVTDGLLSNYCLSYGPETLYGTSPDTTVICHPYALQFRSTGRETDHDGQRDSMMVFLAPICVDENYIRSRLDSTYIKDHPLLKAVYSTSFRAGALGLRWINGVWCSDDIPVDALESFNNPDFKYPKLRGKRANIIGTQVYSRGSKYGYILNISDQHWGGRSKEWVYDKNRRMRVSMAEAVFEMLRREGMCSGLNMPIHMIVSPDDLTQGQNHEYRKRPDPQQMLPHRLELIKNNLLVEAERKRGKKAAMEAAQKIGDLLMFHTEKTGCDYVLHQIMQVMERHMEPNLDVFSAVLRRAQSSNLVIKPVGDYLLRDYGGFDSRNIGVINIGSGDKHFSKTVNFEIVEGPLYAKMLRAMLLALDEWKDQRELIEKWVLAPVYGTQCIGWGVIGIKGKYEYGFEVRSGPTKMSGWGDPLKAHVKNDQQRGNYSKIWEKKIPVIKMFGDKHFSSSVSTPWAMYDMSPAAVHTDEYGEWGFPPNNTGVSFFGWPVDGPTSGPFFRRVLPFDVIKDFMENPKPFDWEQFLPNPA